MDHPSMSSIDYLIWKRQLRKISSPGELTKMQPGKWGGVYLLIHVEPWKSDEGKSLRFRCWAGQSLSRALWSQPSGLQFLLWISRWHTINSVLLKRYCIGIAFGLTRKCALKPNITHGVFLSVSLHIQFWNTWGELYIRHISWGEVCAARLMSQRVL